MAAELLSRNFYTAATLLQADVRPELVYRYLRYCEYKRKSERRKAIQKVKFWGVFALGIILVAIAFATAVLLYIQPKEVY